LAIASFVEGEWRKMRAWDGVTRAIERCGYSRTRTRIDIANGFSDIRIFYDSCVAS